MPSMYRVQSEEQFGNILVKSPSITILCSSKSIFIAKELKTSLGVPDYVLLTERDYLKLQQFAKSYSDIRMTGKYAAVTSYVAKKKGASIHELAMLFNKRRSDVLRALMELEEWGVISFKNKHRNNVMINSGFEIPALESVAIELKLSSWEKALWQAARNGSQFASSCVVMPSNKLDLLNNKLDLFKTNNVNTAVFDISSLTLTPVHLITHIQPVSGRYHLEAINTLVRNLDSFQQVRFDH